MRLRVLLLALGMLLPAASAFGQGCAMCYSSAAGTTEQGKQALSKAVLVLLIPSVGLFTGGIAVAMRYGKKRDEEDSNGEV